MSHLNSFGNIMTGLLLVVFTAAGCSDSTSNNGGTASESEIENRWAAIVDIATNPNTLQEADVMELKGYLAFPFTIRFSDNPDDGIEEEVVTEEEFDQNMAQPEVRSAYINTMILIAPFDIVPDSRDPDIRITGNSATRTVPISAPTMPDFEIGSHVSHWVQTGGEWYLRGVDYLIDVPDL